MPGEGETFRLLQPGLMSVDELNEIMSQRGVLIKSHEKKSKYDLVELYEQQLMPLSQRKFPNSRQGQIINKKIVEEDRKRARKDPKSSDFQFGFKDKPSGSSLKRPISQDSSRLKPPIDSTTSSSKKICLSRKSSDKELDKIIINDRSKRNSESSSEESKTEHSHKADKRPADKVSPVKSQSSKESKEKDKEGERNPKRKKIAWP